jgi:hypothetical protein
VCDKDDIAHAPQLSQHFIAVTVEGIPATVFEDSFIVSSELLPNVIESSAGRVGTVDVDDVHIVALAEGSARRPTHIITA